MKKTILAAVVALAASATGCAKYPDAIAPVTAPAGAYDKLTCKQARAEHEKVKERIAELSDKQRSAATTDAIGVFLILAPLGSVAGNDVAGELATAKGQKLALDARLTQCA